MSCLYVDSVLLEDTRYPAKYGSITHVTRISFKKDVNTSHF